MALYAGSYGIQKSFIFDEKNEVNYDGHDTIFSSSLIEICGPASKKVRCSVKKKVTHFFRQIRENQGKYFYFSATESFFFG